MLRPRDGKKTAFYKAEDTALKYHNQKHFPSLAHVEDYVRKTVLRDKWFRRTFGVRNVRVLASGKKEHSSGNVGYIKMAKEHYIEYIVLHELAHGLAPLNGWAAGDPREQAAHGREYAHTYLLLVQHFMGAEAARKLRVSFRKNKIKYTAPRQISDEQKEKLRQRLALYRIGQDTGKCPVCGSKQTAPTKGNAVGNAADCLACGHDFTPKWSEADIAFARAQVV